MLERKVVNYRRNKERAHEKTAADAELDASETENYRSYKYKKTDGAGEKDYNQRYKKENSER